MRMWEIKEKDREHYDDDYRSYRSKSIDEAYECGYEDGYRAAMKEMEENEEHSYRSMRGSRSRR